MKVTLTGLKQPDKKISSIKTLRSVTGLGLKETKDIVDDMMHLHRAGDTISTEVTLFDPPVSAEVRARDLLELTQFFDFNIDFNPNTVQLLLWKVTCAMQGSGSLRTSLAYILASDDQRAMNVALRADGVDAVTGCDEITGPFKDGQVLFMVNSTRIV